MRNAKMFTVLLAAGLAFSGPLLAHAKKHESQKGGLPALEDRVELDEGQNNWAVIDGTTVPADSNGRSLEPQRCHGYARFDGSLRRHVHQGCQRLRLYGDYRQRDQRGADYGRDLRFGRYGCDQGQRRFRVHL